MEITEFEKKRAANLIWNGAGDYTIRPGFRVYDQEGRADIYWNSIVGAIHRHYDWAALMAFYATFSQTVDQGLYESFFWLGLENAVYQREERERPVFPYLRRQYAERTLAHIYPGISLSRADWIFQGHLKVALGRDSGLPDPVDRRLLKELELGPSLDTGQIISALSATLSAYFTYREGGGGPRAEQRQKERLRSLAFWRRRKKGGADLQGPVRRLAIGYGEHVSEYGSEVLDQSHLSAAFAHYSAQADEGLRAYIADYFGKPILPAGRLREMEKRYCEGNHAYVHLHITRGEETQKIKETGYAGKMRKQALEQAELNRRQFEQQSALYHVALEKLTDRIRGSILTQLDEQTVPGLCGALDPGRAWRGEYLEDGRIFDRKIRGESGNLTVDILLDASASQVHRQETVAAQGYLIAQALTGCAIPVRVCSFCSMNGYLILNLFRDYQETGKNREIFRFFTAGANRDGLALRLMSGLISEHPAEHHILIVLSDCRPNDALKVRGQDGACRDYAGSVGVEDAAGWVHQARMEGIRVMCVFTGGDEDLEAVRRIYGRDFVRIRSLDMFADAVGGMLRNQIAGL